MRVPSSSSVSSFLRFRFIPDMVAFSSLQTAVIVSALMKSDTREYLRVEPMVIRSFEVSGSRPCLSQQLWQSGQWHPHRMYCPCRCGMWNVTLPTVCWMSRVSLVRPNTKSLINGSISHSLDSNASDSSIWEPDNDRHAGLSVINVGDRYGGLCVI